MIFISQGFPESSNVIATIGIKTIDSTFGLGAQTLGFRAITESFPDYTSSYIQQADCSFYQIAAQ